MRPAGSERPKATRLEALLRRERAIALAAIAAVTGICWAYLVRDASRMDPTGMHPALCAAGMQAWTPGYALAMLAMWAVMMIGMMLPSAAPMILLHARVARRASAEGRSLAPTGLFALGYLAVWTLFAAAATGAQWGLDRLALLSPAMVATSPTFGAGVLIAAGLYQMTPVKDACLRRCRAPALFLSEHWRPGRSGALVVGIEHGAFCLGCCWVLMGLLFVGGVMNLLWIAAITLFVLFEKLAPARVASARISGLALAAGGGALLLGWIRL
jgi:predicted metal-binding membrane protein